MKKTYTNSTGMTIKVIKIENGNVTYINERTGMVNHMSIEYLEQNFKEN